MRGVRGECTFPRLRLSRYHKEVKYEEKLAELRRLWKLAPPKMRKAIEAKASALKAIKQYPDDEFVKEVVEALF